LAIDRRFRTITIFAISAVAAVTVLACQSRDDAAALFPESAAGGTAHPIAVNQLAAFLERWTNTAETAGVKGGHQL
jgi:hypothetical protein